MNSTLSWTKKIKLLGASLALALFVAACGGGGGDGGTVGPAPSNAATAADDVFPAVQSAAGGSTPAVQINDSVQINGTLTAVNLGVNASIVAATRTSAAPTAGSVLLNTATGVITVSAGTSAGSYAFTYRLCLLSPNQGVCDDASVTVPVSATPPASDVATTADILACPASSFLISTTNWSGCLAGKRLVGNDPILTSQACQLRFLANGGVEYTHNGVTYLPSVNGQADRGLYQNTASEPSVKLLLGSLDWNLSGAATGNRLTGIDVTVNLRGADLVEVEYFDTGLVRRNLNCSITNL